MKRLIVLVVLLAVLSGFGLTTYAQDDGLILTAVVSTASGDVQGKVEADVENFFGIPFAAPPTGDLRFRPPQDVEPWEGVLSAVEYGNACPQLEGLDAVTQLEDEDCLYLNVQRPIGATADAQLPVFVMIHGGGFVGGTGNFENLNKMVRDNNIIGVAINYRLGTLGALALPALTAEEGQSGNYRYMDMVAALQWVQENIASFGGDPSKVTIGGESAGAMAVCTLMAVPSAQGLFSGAIMMSGGCSSSPLANVEASGVDYAAELGCEGEGAEVAECLRSLPVADFLNNRFSGGAADGTDFLPQSVDEMRLAGELSQVPVMIGGTRDEYRSFQVNNITRTANEYTEEEYVQYVRDGYGENADAVLNVYPWPIAEPTRYSGTYLVAAISSDSWACRMNDYADVFSSTVPTYSYEWAHEEGYGWFPVPGYLWGAGHATELTYFLPDRGNVSMNAENFGDADKQLSDELVAYLGAFIKFGDPNVEGLLEWPAYESDNGSVLSLRGGGESVVIPESAFDAYHNCAFWESLNN